MGIRSARSHTEAANNIANDKRIQFGFRRNLDIVRTMIPPRGWLYSKFYELAWMNVEPEYDLRMLGEWNSKFRD